MREGSNEGRLRLDLQPGEKPLTPKEKEKQRRMFAAKSQPEMDEINRTFEADWARMEQERTVKEFEQYTKERSEREAEEEKEQQEKLRTRAPFGPSEPGGLM